MNGKKNGKGIEYNDYNDSKYEGEYINWIKNGRWKEYYCDDNGDENQLIFDGEYLNDYKLRGKEYYKNGKLKFEIEYLFTEKYNGKIYDYNGNILFELYNDNARIEYNSSTINIFICENLNKKN